MGKLCLSYIRHQVDGWVIRMRPHKLFISYAHHDEVWCSDFVEGFKRRGVAVWFDRHELDDGIEGADLQLRLSDALDGSDLIVLVYSSVSRESPWVAWELMQRSDCNRLIVLHGAAVAMIGAYVRHLANCGVYDAGFLPGASAAEALALELDKLTLIPHDILKGLLKGDPRADALWRLYGYKLLANQP